MSDLIAAAQELVRSWRMNEPMGGSVNDLEDALLAAPDPVAALAEKLFVSAYGAMVHVTPSEVYVSARLFLAYREEARDD